MVSEIFHWVEERSCEEWAKGHLEKCLRKTLEPYLTIDRFDFDGVANVSRRYGDVICLFNFDAKLFDCHWADDKYGDSSVTFDVSIQNLSSYKFEIEADIVKYYKPVSEELKLDLNKKCKEALNNFKMYFETEYVKDISTKLEKFTEKNLKDSDSHMYDHLKQKNSENSASLPASDSTPAAENKDDLIEEKKSSAPSFELKSIFNYDINALYDLFTNRESLANLMRDESCRFELKENEDFSFMDAQISGKCLAFEQNKSLKLKIRFSDWKAEDFAITSIEFSRNSHPYTIHVDFKFFGIEGENEDMKKQSLTSFWQEVFVDNIKKITDNHL